METKVLKLIIKTILLFIIALAIYFIMPRSSDKLLYIPPKNDKYFNDSIKLQNIPLNSFDTFLLKFKNFKPGWIRIDKPTVSKYKLFKKILSNKREKTRKMVMFGGDTIDNFAKTISKQAKLDKNRLINTYNELSPFKEAGILAQKYDIPFNTSEHSTISYMIYKTNSFYKNLAQKEGVEFLSDKFKKKLIIASIIEKETQDYQEMPLIAAVIENRLKKDMKLQVDAALNYGKNSHKIISSDTIKKDNSKFNTYKHKGLPPQPIGSISKVALISAFMPAKVDYLYFVKNPKGGHIFSKNYKKHIQKVKVYKDNLSKLRAKKLYKLLRKNLKVKLPNLSPSVKLIIPKI